MSQEMYVLIMYYISRNVLQFLVMYEVLYTFEYWYLKHDNFSHD